MNGEPGTPANVKLRVAPANYGQVLEAKTPHQTPETAQVVDSDLPLALNGTISQRGEVDWYIIRAKKDQRFRVRTYARTLGSPLDPVVWLRPVKPDRNSKTLPTGYLRTG